MPIPNGLTSHNVIAVKQGSSPLTVLVGAHIDSWGPSPGGNDNASGCGTVLELARDLRDAAVAPTLMFVLFGNEEMIDKDPDHHHYGSRAYVSALSAAERADLVGMISVNMVAYGTTFTMRTWVRALRSCGICWRATLRLRPLSRWPTSETRLEPAGATTSP